MLGGAGGTVDPADKVEVSVVALHVSSGSNNGSLMLLGNGMGHSITG